MDECQHECVDFVIDLITLTYGPDQIEALAFYRCSGCMEEVSDEFEVIYTRNPLDFSDDYSPMLLPEIGI